MKLPILGIFCPKRRKKLLPVALVTTIIGIASSLVPLWADWVATCDYRGVPQLGDRIVTEHFASKEDCEAKTGLNYQQGRCHCAEGGSTTDDSSSAPSGLSPLNQSAYSLGEALGNQIRADDAAAKAKADEIERQRVEKEKYEEEQRRLKYEASKKDLLNNLRDSSLDSGGGLREVGSSWDSSGLRQVGGDEGFMQAPAGKRPKVKHGANYKHPATPTPRDATAPAPKPEPHPKAQEEVAGVQHADMLKDGVQLTGKPEGPLKDQIWVENTSEDPVKIHVWMAGESKNSAHSLRNNIELEPGESVMVGWAANTTNEEPWNYQLGMNVTKK